MAGKKLVNCIQDTLSGGSRNPLSKTKSSQKLKEGATPFTNFVLERLGDEPRKLIALQEKTLCLFCEHFPGIPENVVRRGLESHMKESLHASHSVKWPLHASQKTLT